MGVYSKRPFGGPKEVLQYLARYTHRVAISNRRLVALDDNGVTFKWKDYRIEGPQRYKVMTLDTHELPHVRLSPLTAMAAAGVRYFPVANPSHRHASKAASMECQ